MHPYYSTHADIEAGHKAYGDFINCHSTQNDVTQLPSNEDDTAAAEFFNKHPEFTEKSSHIFNTIYCQTEAANLDTYGSREQESFENSWEGGPGNFRFIIAVFSTTNHFYFYMKLSFIFFSLKIKVKEFPRGSCPALPQKL